VVTEVCARLAQRDDLSMSGRIVVREIAIPSSTHNAAFVNGDGADRYLAYVERAPRAA
jgi:hypothetical protein